jgi:hypothetical protein
MLNTKWITHLALYYYYYVSQAWTSKSTKLVVAKGHCYTPPRLPHSNYVTFWWALFLLHVITFYGSHSLMKCSPLTSAPPPALPPPPGGRTSQAIVEGAMTALRSLVKERLSGKSGGSDYSRQVQPPPHRPAPGVVYRTVRPIVTL